MAKPAAENVYMIHGTKIHFPFKPYGSQMAMMDKVIRCLERKENSLLESPTGSGKSLALLCSSLAWLKDEKGRYEKRMLEARQRALLELERGSGHDSCDEMQSPEAPNECHKLSPCADEAKPAAVKKSCGDKPLEQYAVCTGKTSCDLAAVKVEVGGKSTTTTSDVKQEAKSCNKPCVDMKKEAPEDSATSDDDDFQPQKKRFRTPMKELPAPKTKRRRYDNDVSLTIDEGVPSEGPGWSMQLNHAASKTMNKDLYGGQSSLTRENKGEQLVKDKKKVSPDDHGGGENDSNEPEERDILPKIYFGTRTHKQIAQIVRELNKTKYNTVKMSILASRDHTCIHSEISRSKNKNEDCRKAREGKEGKSCPYKSEATRIHDQRDLKRCGFEKAWDIEEIVTLGKSLKTCPYYMTRTLTKDAEIVFCPYNYLIDPIIRKQMEINLRGQIVILDEAHNIEDCCRGSITWSVSTLELEEAMTDLDLFLSWNKFPEQIRAFHFVCADMRRWIMQRTDLAIDFGKGQTVWEGKDLSTMLEELEFTPESVDRLIDHIHKMMDPQEQPVDEREKMTLKATTWTLLEKLTQTLMYILMENKKFLPDFRVGITKSLESVHVDSAPNGWKRKGDMQKQWVYVLNFWCLNPAVAFTEIAADCRSVILTSGTLSPMSSFSSELGTNFPVKLEANHVVGNAQVWVSSLSVSPTGNALNATYKSSETFEFQDGTGEAIYNICQIVPFGVLVFLPSYGMMNKLVDRWKRSGLWMRLCEIKRTFCEPQGGDKSDFNFLMEDFYCTIQMAEDDEEKCLGAVFFAVCRGKVSEGLDFADNNARAVITIGLPFPSIRDIQVELKRKYNDKYKSTRGLLNGSQWYEIQAFRALNQALGRCIRHKNDWGAILLIDERFGKSLKYMNGLSKWLRPKLHHYNNFKGLVTSLKQFTRDRLEDPCPNATHLSSTLATPGPTTPRASPPVIDLTLPLCTRTRLEDPCPDATSTPSLCHTFNLNESKLDTTTTNHSTFTHDHTLTSLHSHSHLSSTLATPGPSTPRVSPGPTTPRASPGPSTPRASPGPSTPRASPGPSTPRASPGPSTSRASPGPSTPRASPGPSTPRVSPGPSTPRASPGPSTPRVFPGPSTSRASPGPSTPRASLGPSTPRASPGPSTSRASPPIIDLTLPVCTRTSTPHLNLAIPSKVPPPTVVSPIHSNIQASCTPQPDNQRYSPGSRHYSQPTLFSLLASSRDVGIATARTHKDPGSTTPRCNPRGQKLQRKPMFTFNDAPATTERLRGFTQDSTGSRGMNMNIDAGDANHGTTCDTERSRGTSRDIESGDLDDIDEIEKLFSQKYVETEVTSPLLFATSPTSGSHHDVIGRSTPTGKKRSGKGTTEDREVLVGEGGDRKDDLSTKPVEQLEEQERKGESDDTDELEDIVVKKRKKRCETRSASKSRPMDLLDLITCEQIDEEEQTGSNEENWTISCKRCGSVFLSDITSSSGVGPEKKDIPCTTLLGNILSTFFSQKSKERKENIKTIVLENVGNLQQMSPALKCSLDTEQEEIQTNSIYCEEESRCYIPVVCDTCKDSRGSRVTVLAVRAMPCGIDIAEQISPIWFLRGKVKSICS